MKIFCCTHIQYSNIPDDGITVPALVGMNDADYQLKVRDYLPEISKENLLYNEVELEMYINKFVKDEDIIGLIQYSCRPRLNYEDIRQILQYKKIIAHVNNVSNMYKQYCACHKSYAIDAMIDVLKENGIDSNKLDSILNTDILYSRHIFISDYNTYQDYLNWKLNILKQIADRLNIHTVDEAKQTVINQFGSNFPKVDYQSRIFGYLGERLQTIYLNLNFSPDDIHVPVYDMYPKIR